MEVTLEQHGGWSTPLTIDRPAAPRRVDTTALPPEQARELSRLLAAAEAEVNTAPAATSGPSRSAPEAMRYKVTVERSGQQIVLRQSDANMPSAFADLLDWLQRHAALP
jgi:hypothetical protein